MACPLPFDALCVCFESLPLAQLISCKRVCTEWANAIRRTIRSEEWRKRGSNRALIARVPARYSRHESAEEAFATLRVANRLNKRLVTKKCKQIAAVYGVSPFSNGGSAENVLFGIFKQQPLYCLFDKSVRVVQEADTDRICIFSDVRTHAANMEGLNSFALKCNEAGLEVFAFEKEYGGERWYVPGPTTSMIATGYRYLFRGKLAGFVV